MGNPTINIEVTATELNQIIKALSSRRNKKSKRLETWLERKRNNLLVIPEHVADLFIELDANSIAHTTPLIERLEAAAM
jgi:hypothetical protein